MNEEAFLNSRKANWLRLMELCDLADRSPVDLKKADLLELFRLYRKISTDLAVARTIASSPPLITYLNDLTARAYSVVYRQPRQRLKTVLVDSVRLAAQTVRRRRWFVFLSAALFFGSALAVVLLSRFSPPVHDYFLSQVPSGIFDGWKTGKFEERTGSTGAMMAGFYASNNPRVAIITGAVGAGTFGLLSVFMILENAAMLGSLANELIPVNRLDYLFSSISPHGVPEISGLIFSGACGLLLGWSLINPGKLTRGESLRQAGQDAITLLAISIAMTLIAAPIEGFFSFNPHVPGWLKTMVAIASLAVWLFFWTTFGRDFDGGITPHEPLAE